MNTLRRSETWVYLHRIDELRRSGRISTATAVVSTALANRPIMRVSEGRMEMAAKTRTQSKAFAKLVELAQIRAEGQPVFVAIAQNEAREAARDLEELLQDSLPEGSSFMLVELDPTLLSIPVPAPFQCPVYLPLKQPMLQWRNQDAAKAVSVIPQVGVVVYPQLGLGQGKYPQPR